MNAEFFTKPLQGSAFRKMVKKVIMNIGDDMLLDPLPQECVEKSMQRLTNMHPPIRKYSNDTEWKIVVPKGRRSYTKNVVEREKRVEAHFLAQNKFVKV
jgi:hypothetical protein